MAGGNSLEGREQKKGIAVNTLYTMGGLLFMNAVLQIVITPLLNRMMGAEQLGGLFFVCGGELTRRTRCGADGKSSGQAAGNYVRH